ncbi:MAG: DUF4147 domain-containing protein [Bacillota bacterium]|nr:DUF4147 domain-containing protein [Bacillota bacterium]
MKDTVEALPLIKNYAELISHGQAGVRRDALEIVEAGIRGADPGRGTRNLVKLDGEVLRVGNRTYDLRQVDHIYVVGAGKGSFPIAAALEEILGPRITRGVVVVKNGEQRRLARIEILEAGHPLPDENSVSGARQILELAELAGPRDLVFAVFTGGASALAILPPAGIGLQEIQELTDLLLKCGAPIDRINAVRKHLCQLKGGRLVARIQPAEAITLTLDTAPENMPWPDMCLADPSTFQDAVDILRHYDLWERVAPSIQAYLLEGVARPERETVKSLAGMKAVLFSVGDPVGACEAAADRSRALGYRPVILSTRIEGEAKDLGIFLAGVAREILKAGRPFQPPCALISGGETTVTIGDTCGSGGPNQETVLGFARHLSCLADVACIAVDTDGTDGPTDAAGGVADGLTFERAREAGLNLEEYLKTHNTLEALGRLNDLVVTGHTGTNVMNLRVVLIR